MLLHKEKKGKAYARQLLQGTTKSIQRGRQKQEEGDLVDSITAESGRNPAILMVGRSA